MIGISIAIATFNRADVLRVTLTGLLNLKCAADCEYEIIVVGNCCTDATAQVVQEFAAVSPNRVRYVDEPRQGLSHARNRAIAESRHGVIAFLDDDVDVDPDWLCALAAAYASGDYAAVGGRAHLVFPGPRPAWLSAAGEGHLTRVELGPDRRPAKPDEIFGVNVSFRRDWLDRVGGFRTDLGRVGTCLMGSEETELLERIERAGGKLLYEPCAVVGHRVPRERLRRRWFWSRCYWGSRGAARMTRPADLTWVNLLRWSWWVTLAVRDLARVALTSSPRSVKVFDASNTFADRLGSWVGFLGGLLTRRGRQGRGASGSSEPSFGGQTAVGVVGCGSNRSQDPRRETGETPAENHACEVGATVPTAR